MKNNLRKQIENYYFYKSVGFNTPPLSIELRNVLMAFNAVLRYPKDLQNILNLRNVLSPLGVKSNFSLDKLRTLILKRVEENKSPKDLLLELFDILGKEAYEKR